MGSRLVGLVAVCATLASTACMSSGTLVKRAEYDRFEERRATRAEVRGRLGNPDVTYDVGQDNCDAYEYVANDVAESKRVDFCYDTNGVLIRKNCLGACGR